MTKYREFLIDSDYTPMTEFCKPDDDDIHVIEKSAYDALQVEAEALAGIAERMYEDGGNGGLKASEIRKVLLDWQKFKDRGEK